MNHLKNMKKIIFLVILVAVFCVTGTAFAMTESERQAMIKTIMDQIVQLQAKISELKSAQIFENTSSDQADLLDQQPLLERFIFFAIEK